jgi:translation initiation factor IF-1
MSSDDSIKVMTTVIGEILPGLFRVEMPNGHQLQAHLSREARLILTRILPGEKVMVQLSPFDLSRGRILTRRENIEKQE